MATRQQRRFEERNGGPREVGFTPMRAGRKYRQRLSQTLTDNAPQWFKPTPDGGYLTYHPTKGWRRVSPKRLKNFPGLGA